MTEKQPAALETKNEQSESKPNTAKRYKTEKAELRRRIVDVYKRQPDVRQSVPPLLI